RGRGYGRPHGDDQPCVPGLADPGGRAPRLLVGAAGRRPAGRLIPGAARLLPPSRSVLASPGARDGARQTPERGGPPHPHLAPARAPAPVAPGGRAPEPPNGDDRRDDRPPHTSHPAPPGPPGRPAAGGPPRRRRPAPPVP